MKTLKWCALPLVAIALFFGSNATAVPRGQRAPATQAAPRTVEVHVATVVPSADGMIVLLKTVEGEKYLPIWVGAVEANAIEMRRNHLQFPRPLTHDLLETVIRTLEARVVRVTVVDLRDGTFFGQIDLRAGRREHHIDARSSDSIAVALGTGAPIFVARHVMDAAGLDRTTLERDGYQGTPVPLDMRHTL